MDTPSTDYRTLYTYLERKNGLIVAAKQGLVTEVHIALDSLLSEFAAGVSIDDMGNVRDLEELRSRLREAGIAEDSVAGYLAHESQHYEAARRAGVRADYAVWNCILDGKQTCVPLVTLDNHAPLHDLQAAFLAVDEPSDPDSVFDVVEGDPYFEGNQPLHLQGGT